MIAWDDGGWCCCIVRGVFEMGEVTDANGGGGGEESCQWPSCYGGFEGVC